MFIISNNRLNKSIKVSDNYQINISTMKKIDMQTYQANPQRYELRKGNQPDAPLCPYGNHYQWIGYDLEEKSYIRFTKSVFKLLVAKIQ